TAAGGFQPGENADQGGFATTGRPDHTDEFPAMGFEMDIPEGGDRALGGLVGFVEALYLQHHLAVLEAGEALAHLVALVEVAGELEFGHWFILFFEFHVSRNTFHVGGICDGGALAWHRYYVKRVT